MGSSLFLYRELMQAKAIGKIYAYSDEVRDSINEKTGRWELFYKSLFCFTADEIVGRIMQSAEGSVCDIIEDYAEDMEDLSEEAEIYANRVNLMIQASYARKIRMIFE